MRAAIESMGRSRLIELGFLSLFFFFLPLREAPKNIFLVCYFITWIWHRWQDHQWGSKDWGFETPLLMIALLGIVSVWSNNVNSFADVAKNFDYISMAMLAILLRRSAWHVETLLKTLIICTGCGTAVALIEGLLIGESQPYLQSVGHINHVAIFLTIFLFVIFSASLGSSKRTIRFLMIFLSIVTFFCVFATDSRNAIGTTAVVIPALMLLSAKMGLIHRKTLVSGFLLFVFGFALALIQNPEIYQKQLHHLAGNSIDTEREKIWRSAVTAFEAKPLFGHGVGSYSKAVDEETISRLVTARGDIYIASEYGYYSHAHNLWLTWLVERGVIATLLLTAWFAYLLLRSLVLVKQYASSKLPSSSEWAPVGAKDRLAILMLFSGVFGVMLLGVWNTSFHHEHGLLSMAVIAIAYAQLDNQPSFRDPNA